MARRIIYNLKELEQFARQIARDAKSGDVIGLVGELGAGKTTFVQYLAKALGVKVRVNSPTFLVMRVYETVSHKLYAVSKMRLHLKAYSLKIVHIDAYRLKDPRELEAIGAMEYMGVPGAITVIEWADRVKSVLPKKTKWVYFEHGKKEHERLIHTPSFRSSDSDQARMTYAL